MCIFFEANERITFEADKVSMNEKDKRALIGAVVCIGIIIIIGAVQYAFPEEEADEYWLIPNIHKGYELRWVPVYYVDEITNCGDKDPDHVRGCYYHGPNRDDIHIVNGKSFEWANQGCTVRDHEWFHAMGYQHGKGPLSVTCPNPEWKWEGREHMAYDSNNIFHKDLTKDYRNDKDIDPRKIIWR